VSIGNKSASGTEIIDELAEEEIATGHMIVYTSADSVLQICGNEETFGLDELYRCCEIAREITMKDEWKVGRVIARPYVGKKKGEFKRTANRHDYALKPYGKTALDALKEAGFKFSPLLRWHCGNCDFELPENCSYQKLEYHEVFTWSEEDGITFMKEGARDKKLH
jgi:phosphopentomutase